MSKASVERRTDVFGRVFDSVKTMCDMNNVKYSTFYGRLKKGATQEEALFDEKLPQYALSKEEEVHISTTLEETPLWYSIESVLYPELSETVVDNLLTRVQRESVRELQEDYLY